MATSNQTGDITAKLNAVGALIGNAPAHVLSISLAEAFGWSAADIRGRSIQLGETKVGVSRGYIGVQPAAVFAAPVHRNGYDPVVSTALYAYHAAVRWGAYADKNGITIFNSHWLAEGDWYRLPTIEWGKLNAERQTLEAMRPSELASGELDRIALSRGPSPTLLRPVDDELVNRLDRWRDEALRHSRNQARVDESLQQLFAQLFVLRTVEDRDLAPQLVTLESTLRDPENIDLSALRQLFQSAELIVGGELFEDFAAAALPEHVVAGVISDLYKVRGLPAPGFRYNFSWIDSDVLGLAYEKYLSTILLPLPPPAQAELFRQAERDVGRLSVRRASGVYYTPPFITGYLAKRCLDEFYSTNDHKRIPSVIDFACGSGSFLVAAVDYILNHLKKIDKDRNWAREIIESGHINGVDFDEKAVTVARLNIWQRLTEEPDPLPLPRLSDVIVQGDGLRSETWKHLRKQHDVVLGNPPFLTTSRVPDREYLEATFQTAKGRYDFSYLFVEQAIRVAAPAGIIGMVVPNRLYRNNNGGRIREIVTQKTNLLTIIDFGANEVFAKTSAYIGCVVARVRSEEAPFARSVRVIDVKELTLQFVAALLLETEKWPRDGETRILRSYVAQHPRGSSPWLLLSRSDQFSQVRLGEESELLSAVAGVFQGIRTGANEVFIVTLESDDDVYLAEVTNGLGDRGVVERQLLRPVIFGSELQRYDFAIPTKWLLYPYTDGKVVAEPELERFFPNTMAYFDQYREILAARGSIAASGLRWYELVRRRDEEWLTQPKLLIRDLAPETSFAVDVAGNAFLVGGTAVVPQREDSYFSAARISKQRRCRQSCSTNDTAIPGEFSEI